MGMGGPRGGVGHKKSRARDLGYGCGGEELGILAVQRRGRCGNGVREEGDDMWVRFVSEGKGAALVGWARERVRALGRSGCVRWAN
jgi:hypothetical protein